MSRSAAYRIDLPAYEAPARAAVVLPFPTPKAPEPELTNAERQVIWLSRFDPAPAGRLKTWAAHLFGFRGVGQPLADPKLEAMRRFAVILRTTKGRPTQAEVARFVAAGYDEALLFPIYELVATLPKRDASARFWRMAVSFAVLFGVLPPVAIALTDYFDDPRLGVVGTALMFVTAVPLFAKLMKVASQSSQ